ncbi:hypothetical protein RIR_jg41691.t1 [Rhizophagus irregularis DAOM 181602=DAOM 197198]|nr:hypothetical protein RIR_jg41691.t1 [Rhizophagus irregularis DAOM 181602=DAOM 197198]
MLILLIVFPTIPSIHSLKKFKLTTYNRFLSYSPAESTSPAVPFKNDLNVFSKSIIGYSENDNLHTGKLI